MKNPKVCCEKYCRKPKGIGHARCYAHMMKRWRTNNPLAAAYQHLKDSARQRGIPFTLTISYFSAFAIRTGYVDLTGNEAHCLTVDRKNNLLGYVPGNIQPLTRAENAMKQARQDERRVAAGFAWKNDNPPNEKTHNGSNGHKEKAQN